MDSPEAKRIFLVVSDLPPAERAAAIERECGDNRALRSEVEALVNTDDFREMSTAPEIRAAPAAVGPTKPVTPSHPERIGGYRIKSVIASGGMGTVYLARQESPRRTVALKVMKRGIVSKSAMKRFEYESQILARLRHPNVAQVYESGTHDDSSGGVPYFAMEYIPGAKSVIEHAEAKTLGTRERLALFRKICDAVHHGHTMGVIHRDLKPGNILVDSYGEPKIIDFGVARSTDSDLAVTTLQTDVGQLIGTLQYMSPEQCDADPHDLDTRSDVYALGVVLYQLLCGSLPYDITKAALHEAARVIREDEPAKPSTINRTLRGDVETIALKALEKDRDRRYSSAEAFGEDIRRYLDHEPIQARPPNLAYQFVTFTRRHRPLIVGVAAVFLVLVVATLVSARLAIAKSIAEREAIVARDQEARAAQRERDMARREASANTELRAKAGELEEALREAHEWQEKTDAVQRLVDAATLLTETGDYRRAWKLHEEALTIDPASRLARERHIELALVWLRDIIVVTTRGESFTEIVSGIIPVLVQGVEGASPDRAATYLAHIGWAMQLERREKPTFSDFEEYYRRAITLDPDNVYANCFLGSHLSDNDDAKARACFSAALDSGLDRAFVRRFQLAASLNTVRAQLNTPVLSGAIETIRIADEMRRQGEARPSPDLTTGILRCYGFGYDYDASNVEGLLDALPAPDHLATVRWLVEAEGVKPRSAWESSQWRYVLARLLEANDDADAALDAYEQLLSSDAGRRFAPLVEARIERVTGAPIVPFEFELKMALAEGATSQAKNELAWTLLTCEPADRRDPETALALAVAASDMTDYGDPVILDTLSLAYHMTGDTEKAVETQKKALSLLPTDAPGRDDYEAALARYEAALADEAASDPGAAETDEADAETAEAVGQP